MPDPSSPIPAPKPTDHEDVSWALSTAEATWKRGDHGDALKWLQRAAEAASEAGLDARYLELAKAASELAARTESTPRMRLEDSPLSGATVVQAMRVVLPEPGAGRIARPGGGGKGSSPPRPVLAPAGRSSPPAAVRPSASPPRATAPKTTSKPSPGRVAGPGTSRSNDRKASGAAPAAGPVQTPIKAESRPSAEQVRTVRNLDTMSHLASLTRAAEAGDQRIDPRPLEPEDQTQLMGPASVAPKTEAQPNLGAFASAEVEDPGDDHEVEPWPTQTSKRAAEAARVEAARNATAGSPGGVGDATLVPDPNEPHSMPTQALRVVLYRTPDGVRIAPAGTRPAALSIDALIVALDPSADLAAWLK